MSFENFISVFMLLRIFLVGTTLVFAIRGAITLLKNPMRLKHFTPTDGEIIELLKYIGSHGRSTFSYTVRFTIGENEMIYFRPAKTSRRYKKGETVPVLYNPSRPKEAVINTVSQLWLEPLGSIAVFLFVFYFCFGILH